MNKTLIAILISMLLYSCSTEEPELTCAPINENQFIIGILSKNDSTLSRYFEAKYCVQYKKGMAQNDSSKNDEIKNLYRKWYLERLDQIYIEDSAFTSRMLKLSKILNNARLDSNMLKHNKKNIQPIYRGIPDSIIVYQKRSLDSISSIDSFMIETPHIPDQLFHGKYFRYINVSKREKRIVDSLLWNSKCKWRSVECYDNIGYKNLNKYLKLTEYHWGGGFHIESFPIINEIDILSNPPSSVQISYMKNLTQFWATDRYFKEYGKPFALYSSNEGPDQ